MDTHEGGAGIAPAMTAVAVIAAVAGSLWWNTREEPQAPASAPLQPVAVEAPAATPPPHRDVVAFVGFAQAEPPAELPLDHGYTSQGLRQLALAMAAVGGNSLWRDRARRLEEAGARLERDAHSLDHADIARAAFVQAAEWIAELQGEADEALEAARAIDAQAPLGAQAEAVARFFRRAAATLHAPRGDAGDTRA